MADYRSEAPEIIRDFLIYHETIKGHSKLTINEYYLDLRTFFRYMVQKRGIIDKNAKLSEIDISAVDKEFVASVTLSDVYDFMGFLSRDREKRHNSPESGNGLNAASRSRKIATIRSFYKYLTTKANILEDNPVLNLDTPKLKQSLPRYLTADQSKELLGVVDGPNRARDYCILTLFLNCGMRISELVGLNIYDINEDSIRVLGKGNKERTIFLNDACREALSDYMLVRNSIPSIESGSRSALFVTRQNRRITKSGVHFLVKKYLLNAGLDTSKYSAHKLRHTAATLMHQSGVDVRTLQEVLGHDHLNTTQIYTHIENKDLREAATKHPLGDVTKKDIKKESGNKKKADAE